MAINEAPHLFGERLEIIVHHKSSGLTGYGESTGRWDGGDTMRYRMNTFDPSAKYPMLPVFRINRMASKLTLRFDAGSNPLESFFWADTRPSMMMVEEHDICTLPLFKQLGAPIAEELIVDPATVFELLEKIRHQQSPDQAAIRERNRRREAANSPTVHASILSFAA